LIIGFLLSFAHEKEAPEHPKRCSEASMPPPAADTGDRPKPILHKLKEGALL
jgi:hypothetical protein